MIRVDERLHLMFSGDLVAHFLRLLFAAGSTTVLTKKRLIQPLFVFLGSRFRVVV